MDSGDVAIQLGDEPLALKCTLGAAKEINARFGSFSAAGRQVDLVDAVAITFIVAKGLNKPIADVEKKVYAAGYMPLMAPINEYLMNLANGGKPKKKDSDDEENKTGE